jgi:cytoskeletal protein RodZ
MICQWCQHETKTLDICEWCKRPLKGGKKKGQPTPGEAHLRAKALAQVKKNDRLLIYSMLGVLVLTALVVSYTVVAQPAAADELPAYLDIKKWRDRPQKDVKTTPDVEGAKTDETEGEAVQTEKPADPADPDTPVSSEDAEQTDEPKTVDETAEPDPVETEPDTTEPAPDGEQTLPKEGSSGL